mgnify:CR=1 FL=1
MFGIRTHEVMRVAVCAGSLLIQTGRLFIAPAQMAVRSLKPFAGKQRGEVCPTRAAGRSVRRACLMSDAVSDDIDGGVFRSSGRQEIDLGTDREKYTSLYFLMSVFGRAQREHFY